MGLYKRFPATLRLTVSCLAIVFLAPKCACSRRSRIPSGWMLRQTTDSTGRAIVLAPPHEQLLMMVRRLGFASALFPVVPSDSDDVLVVAIAYRKPLDLMAVVRQYVKGCTMIYIDGQPLLHLRDVDIRQVIGIEVYASNVQAPPQFPNPMDSEHRCNTIVIWRRF